MPLPYSLDLLANELATIIAQSILDRHSRDLSDLPPEELHKVSFDLAHDYEMGDSLYELAEETFNDLMGAPGTDLLNEAMQRYPELDIPWPKGGGTIKELVGLSLDCLMTLLVEQRYMDQHIARAIQQLVKRGPV
jgi:hypothetical protein